MKKIFIKLFAVLSAVIFAITASGTDVKDMSTSYSWYCKREKDNKQPTLPPEFSFISLYDGYWIDNSAKDTSANKVAYLTFDAGYENGNVSRILDTLKEKEVCGAFFILLNLVENEPALVRRMVDEGHTVCNHTAHHKDMTKIRDSDAFGGELSALGEAFEKLTGTSLSKYYRPPEGRFSPENLECARALGYKTIFWSFAYADWDNNKQMSREAAKKKILDNIHNGAVLLLHPTSKTNADILGEVIDEMKKEGYRFGTLDELVENASVG
jgi:peptidoglycan-N-acetylmuramic acid deacetylase